MKKNSNPVIIVFVAAIVSVAWFAWQAWSADSAVVKINERVRLTSDRIRQLEQVAYMTKTLESAVRGYVITGDTGFLVRTDQMETHLRTPVLNLQVMSRGNRADELRMDSLKTAVLKRIVLYNYLVAAAREAPVMAGAMIQTRKTPAPEDGLTLLIDRCLEQEHARLNNLLGTQWFHRKPFLLSIIGSIVAALVMLGGLYRIAANLRRARTVTAALTASEEKYRQLIEDAGTTLFTTNRGGFFTYVNKKALELTGYTAEELINKQYTMLLDPPVQKELREFYENQSFDGTPESTYSFPIRMKNGEKKWVEQHVVLVERNGFFAGYQCAVKDVHQKRMADEQLAEAKKEMNILNSRMQSILENTTSIVFIKDVHGRYLHVNRRFEEVFGVTLKEIKNRSDKDFPNILHPDKHALTDRTVILFEKPQEMEESIEIGNETRYFFINKFPLRDHTLRVYGLCGIATDITPRIEVEHKLIEARRKAENAKKAQEVFMANMSHELRTPLNGIIGVTNLLQQLEGSPELREYVSDIRESAGNLLVLVDDLLDFSRIRTGQLHLAKEDFDPRHLILRAAGKHKQRAAAKGLAFHCELAEAVKDHVLGDPTRLNQVLENLLDNAVKFTETGEVRLTVKVAAANEKNTMLLFELQDTGIGIPAPLLHDLGEGFSQLQGGNDRKHSGTGLGLALTRQLILLQHGNITIRNNPAGGTVVSFSIPFSRSFQTAAPAEPVAERAPLEGRHILVAEDNLLNQKVAFRLLQQAGASVTLAENGVAALQQLQEHNFDCVLMDIQMPEMDGLNATRKIRDMGSGIPIIAMTASALRGDRERCLLTGMNEYISKPFVPEDLFRKIQEVLGEKEPSLSGFINTAPDESQNRPFIDLLYLRNILEDDKDYLLDVLGIFMECTAGTFTHLLNNAKEQAWEEASRHASLLRNSLMIVKIHPLSDMMQQIEQHARSRSNLENIIPNIELAIKIYHDAQSVLKREMEDIRNN